MTNKKSAAEILIYILLLLCVILFRGFVLAEFGFRFTDGDQCIMWHGLADYSKGVFHEPRFYGQAYSTMAEALFAVPFYYCGLPPWKALPLVTSMMTLFPYVLISLFAFKKRSPFIASVIISVPLLLSPEYGFITTIPRGFVPGIFIASLGWVSVFYPHRRRSFLLAAFASVVAFSVNANSVIVSLPCLGYLLLENFKNRQFYFYAFPGFLAGAIIHGAAAYFYFTHPHYNLHRQTLRYSFSLLAESFDQLDLFFNHNMPVLWNTGFLVLFIFPLMSIPLFRERRYAAAITLASIPLFIIATLGLDKVHDGTASVFFSTARFYIGIPPLIALCITLLPTYETPVTARLFFVVPLLFLILHLSILEKRITAAVDPRNEHVVSVQEVAVIRDECRRLKDTCLKYRVGLVVISSHWYYDIYTFGCPSCNSDFPSTLRPSYERRTWRLLEDEKKVYRNVLIVDVSETGPNSHLVKKLGYGLYLVQNNSLLTMQLLDSLKINCREYRANRL